MERLIYLNIMYEGFWGDFIKSGEGGVVCLACWDGIHPCYLPLLRSTVLLQKWTLDLRAGRLCDGMRLSAKGQQKGSCFRGKNFFWSRHWGQAVCAKFSISLCCSQQNSALHVVGSLKIFVSLLLYSLVLALRNSLGLFNSFTFEG